MAPPRAGGPRRSTQASEHLYTLGERGRKTGVTLRDTGVRDEHGMEPIDSLFSSPTKSRHSDASDTASDDDDDDDDDDNGEADMDLTTASGPDPAALLNGQRSAGRFGARPQTRSPAKALLGSPAVRGSAGRAGAAAMRQNPLLRPPSSPENIAPQSKLGSSSNANNNNSSSPSKPVKRRLDFGKKTASATASAQRLPFKLAPPNGAVRSPRAAHVLQDEDEDEDDQHPVDTYDDDDDDEPQPVVEEEEEAEEEEAEPVRRRPGRPGRRPAATTTAAAATAASPKVAKRGRPRKSGDSDAVRGQADGDDDDGEEQQSAKRQRVAMEAKPRGRPRGRPPAKRPPPPPEAAEAAAAPDEKEDAAAAAPKKRGRKRKSSGVGAATAAAAAVPRGPPLPKSRGLVIQRREMGGDGASILKTRSGRSSFRPLAFWRNEHVEFDPTDVQQDVLNRAQHGSRRFLLPSVRDIVRVDDDMLPPLATKMGAHNRGGGGGGAGRKQKRRRRGGAGGGEGGEDDDDADEDEDSREPWEKGAGKVTGEVIVWYPEYEVEPPGPGQDVEMTRAEIALSSAAIQTHEVRGSTFRFVKTLSMPFFGTGMVDMPPGSEKKFKNSRKMHMTFFVHYGQVVVKVHESVFRISKGGMWSVPRGNYYSITNDTDHPARLFFAQGCEVRAPLEED